jgi:hypothetical protein
LQRMGGRLSPGATTLSWGRLGLQSFWVSEASDLIGSSLPLRSLPEGGPLRFSLRRPARMRISSGRSSLGLSLPSRARLHCRRRWRGYPLRGFLPCGSFPFGVFPVPGSYSSRGVPILGYVPSQRFARSQGLFPPGACRPCCMPVPPLGFRPSRSSSLAEPSVLSDVVALLGLARRPATVPASGARSGSWGYPSLPRLHARRRRLLRQAPLQGFAPCECPCLRQVFYAEPETATLVGFVLPREFSLFAGDPPRGPSSLELRFRCAG